MGLPYCPPFGGIFALGAAVTTFAAWERAEIERSASEAAHTPVLQPTSAGVVRRYADPPSATAFALEYAFHLVGDLRGRRVLDLGCGSGANTSLLAARGGRVIAVDISDELLGLTSRRVRLDGLADQVAAIRASAHVLPLADQSVDAIFGNAVLHHLHLDSVACEIRRVLAPGGRAIFREPLRNSPLFGVVRRAIPYRQPDVSPFEHPLQATDVERFASHFDSWEHREFELPLVRLADVLRLPVAARNRLRGWDRRLLARSRTLRRYASLCVFAVRKA